MSIKTEIERIQTHVSSQTDLIEQITTALEGKSSTTPIYETCTVNIVNSDSLDNTPYVVYTSVEDGKLVGKTASLLSEALTVACGTALFIKTSPLSASCEIGTIPYFGSSRGIFYQAPYESGVTDTITYTYD